jgi:hypothetical protein
MQIGLRTLTPALALSSALAVFASPAAAVPTNKSGQTAAVPKPLPAASWHGRPIRRPDRAGLALVAANRGATSPSLAFGAGYGRPNGSPRVREVQRLLHRIGYRPGPVDGMFGPLTRSSVQWFQIKHNLRPSGVVDAATLALLRLRSRGDLPAAAPAPATAPATPATPATPGVPARAPAPAAPAPTHSSGGSPAWAIIAGALALLALLAALLLLLLRRRRARPVSAEPEPEPEPPAAPMPPPALKPASAARPRERVVAYTTGKNPRELRHQAEKIERACSERGWALAQVVRERRNGNGNRPGLRFALQQLADGAGSRLVTCRVNDVGRNQAELAALLRWCARTGVDLVALDVGLDTGTSSGKLVARSLVSPARRTRFGRTLRRRRGKAPGDVGELAPTSSP